MPSLALATALRSSWRNARAEVGGCGRVAACAAGLGQQLAGGVDALDAAGCRGGRSLGLGAVRGLGRGLPLGIAGLFGHWARCVCVCVCVLK